MYLAPLVFWVRTGLTFTTTHVGITVVNGGGGWTDGLMANFEH